MFVLVTVAIAMVLLGSLIFVRSEHTMQQVEALICFLMSTLFLALALIVQDLRTRAVFSRIAARRSSRRGKRSGKQLASP